MFEEHFVDNSHNWHACEDLNGFARIEPEYYRLEHRPVDRVRRVVYSDASLDCDLGEFSMQAALEWLDGDGFSGYGLAWGVADEDNHFEFSVSATGQFRVVRWTEGRHREIVPWTATGAVRSAASVNILELRRIAQDVFLLINSELVCVLPSSEAMHDASGSYFGFAVSGRASLRAHFMRVQAARSPVKERPGRRFRDAKLESTGVIHEVPAQDSLERVTQDIGALVGLRQAKREFARLANVARLQRWRRNHDLPVMPSSLHLIFSGPPGTGKTTLARLVGRLYRAVGLLEQGHVLEVGSADLIAGYTGQTLQKVQHAIDRAWGGVLFVDEAYLLAGDHWYCEEALNVLVKNMEDRREQFAVVLAGYEDQMRELVRQNPGLRSRFQRHLRFEPYSSRDLLCIFEGLCLQHRYTLSEGARAGVALLFQASRDAPDRSSGNGRFVRNVFERLIEAQASRLTALGHAPDRDALQQLTVEDVRSLEALLPVAAHLN